MFDKKFQNEVAKILIDIESVKFAFNKPFTLTSGLKSPVYVDCRKIISFVDERNIILDFTEKYFEDLKLEFEILAGGETAGIPYAAFLSERLNKQMIYIRKKPKEFGKRKQIEGSFKSGQKTILIEDLATDGGSKVTFVKALRENNLEVSDIFVIFFYDIFEYATSPLKPLNINIHALCTWKNIIDVLTKEKIISEENIKNLKFFLKYPKKWRENNGQ